MFHSRLLSVAILLLLFNIGMLVSNSGLAI